MKLKSSILFTMLGLIMLMSCKKESTSSPTLTFTNNAIESTANVSGDYTITGHISSAVRLDKVVLTKEGQNTAFIIDETTAKNKTEYDFSYLVSGISTNTYIVIDTYDQAGGKITQRFLIKKY
jgi:hypothetical protein